MKICPECNEGTYVIKVGFRNTIKGRMQKYYCRNCGINYTDNNIDSK